MALQAMASINLTWNAIGHKNWIIYLTIGLHTVCSLSRAQLTCNDGEIKHVTCESHGRKYRECTVEDARMILSVEVEEQLSKSDCEHQQNPPGDSFSIFKQGIYGFNQNKLWVDGGCRATFQVCYTVAETSTRVSTTEAVKTLSTESTKHLSESSHGAALVTSEELLSEATASSPANVNTEKLDKDRKADVSLIVGISVPLVVIVLGFVVVGIIFWRKRVLKKGTGGQECIEEIRDTHKSKKRASYQESNNYKVPCKGPLRTDDNYLIIEPEHEYTAIACEDKSEKRQEAESLDNNYSTIDSENHYISIDKDDVQHRPVENKHVTTASTSDIPKACTDEPKEFDKPRNQSGATENHNYFILEPQNIHSFQHPQTEKATNDHTPIETDALENHTYSVLESAIPDGSNNVVQSLPDNEYNTLNVKSKKVFHDQNYDVCSGISQGNTEIKVYDNNDQV